MVVRADDRKQVIGLLVLTHIVNNGIISSEAFAHKMHTYQSTAARRFAWGRGAIEKDFSLRATQTTILTHHCAQAFFVVVILQPESGNFGDEVMSINYQAFQFLHEGILSQNYAMILVGDPLKKLLPYLLLNIIVSAVTMLLVLVIWDKTHPLASQVLRTTSTQQASGQTQTITTMDPATTEAVLEVQSVLVPGQLDAEKVTLRSVSTMEIDLNGWQVTNGSGKVYTFPSLTLYPGGVIVLYSKSGVNTAAELYWGLDKPVWAHGATVTVLDAAGNEREHYGIP